MKYQCSKCKLAVIVTKEKEPKTIKACKCDAPVIGEMEASLKGVTVMADKKD